MSWECVYRTPTAEGDHCKYATDYAKQGIACYGNQDIADKKKFPFGTYTVLGDSVTKNIGSFRVAPVPLCHDVPIYGYLVYHPQMGVLFFATDTYKIPEAMTGVDHFLIEANYSDEILKDNVWKGEVDKAQADRIMLSHMSLEYCIQYLRDSIDLNTKTITLCHLSERNSAFDLFRRKVAGVFGIPTYVAYNGFVVNLNKEEI